MPLAEAQRQRLDARQEVKTRVELMRPLQGLHLDSAPICGKGQLGGQFLEHGGKTGRGVNQGHLAAAFCGLTGGAE